MGAPEYPFEPKSNAHLTPGDFWALPLRDGRFAAGRVLAVPAFGPADRLGVVVALLDWLGDKPPTTDEIAGRPVLVAGKTRIETITKTGGTVLGNRPLSEDGIEPPVERLQLGDKSSVWGWRTILNRAERHFIADS